MVKEGVEKIDRLISRRRRSKRRAKGGDRFVRTVNILYPRGNAGRSGDCKNVDSESNTRVLRDPPPQKTLIN